MPKKRNTQNDVDLAVGKSAASKNNPQSPGHDRQWSSAQRTVASIALLAFLFVLLLGPLNNPVGSDHFSRPLGRWVAPVHQALFLGHGYRFFGPDPGPGHWIECRTKMADGSLLESRFPDRQQHWPRLLYHRWFMLAETLFSELNGTPDQASFDQNQQSLQRELDQLRRDGKLAESLRLAAQRDELDKEYNRARERIDQLLESIGRHFLRQQPEAVSVQLILRERSIPFPDDISAGVKLDDQRYVSEPAVIGDFSRGDLFAESLLPKTLTGNDDSQPGMEVLP